MTLARSQLVERTRDSFTEDDFIVAKGSGREDGCEGVYGDEYRTFVRHCAFEEWLPSGGQLKTQNCKRDAKAKTDGQSDLLKKTGRACSSAHRHPRSSQQVKCEKGDKKIDELFGDCDRKVTGKDRHDHHGADKNRSGATVQITALAGEQRYCPRDEADHAGADMDNIGNYGQGVRQRNSQFALRDRCSLCIRVSLMSPALPIAQPAAPPRVGRNIALIAR